MSWSWNPIWMRWGGCLLLVVILLGNGCDSGTGTYPVDLLYPIRSDVLVVQKGQGEGVNHPIPPGKLDEFVRDTDRRQGKTVDPLKIPEEQRKILQDELRAFFGRPVQPWVRVRDDHEKVAVVEKMVAGLNLNGQNLRTGSVLYRRHCLHCHGVAGDGRGPTGPWISPPPRDYRQGIFKFTSTGGAPKPNRQDLYRTLYNGLEGSAMPPFSLLREEELEALVSYVIHLSIRGEVEFAAMQSLIQNGDFENDTPAEFLQKKLVEVLEQWESSNAIVVTPSEVPTYKGEEERLEAVSRGYQLFTDEKRNLACRTCHVDFGRQSNYRFDDWGTLGKPNNLTNGIYRAGRRPIDLYWRIRSGIKPIMQKFGDKPEELPEKDAWDLIAFLEALPYPAMLPPEVRKIVYGPAPEPALLAGQGQ